VQRYATIFRVEPIGTSKSYSGWDAFVKGNEDRVSKRK